MLPGHVSGTGRGVFIMFLVLENPSGKGSSKGVIFFKICVVIWLLAGKAVKLAVIFHLVSIFILKNVTAFFKRKVVLLQPA